MSEHELEWILRDLGGERIRHGEGGAHKGVVEDAMKIDDRTALAHVQYRLLLKLHYLLVQLQHQEL